MKRSAKAMRRRQKEQQNMEDNQDDEEADDSGEPLSVMKHATRNSGYKMCIDSGLSKQVVFAARRSDSFWSGVCHRIRVGWTGRNAFGAS